MLTDQSAPGVRAFSQPDLAGRRTRLREYQVQLLERMQAAKMAGGARVNQLGILIGNQRYLLDLTQAGAIVPVASLTEVPRSQPWFLGLCNIRGNLIGIIDMARYLGLTPPPIGPDSRILTFATNLQFNCGLVVARVFGLRNAGEMQVSDSGLKDAEGNEWAVLDLRALVQETRFLHVGL